MRRRSTRSYHNHDDRFPLYRSADDQQHCANKQLKRLNDEGIETQPIAAFKTRGIAKSFWGHAWCRHLESFSDYESRLPRGRSYLRNGSVIHLAIEAETVKALVSGSRLYELTIHVDPLDPERWSAFKNRAKGQISSVIELLQGSLPEDILKAVTHIDTGLFPSPREIRFNCNCPDWADMCKHVAAVMYGIGKRLDDQPELLFKLRGVDHQELIHLESAIDEMTHGRPSRRRRTLDNNDMTNLFDIDLE
jgi:uncharacterized Zn finger protein